MLPDIDFLGYEVVDRPTKIKGVVTSMSYDIQGCIQGLVVYVDTTGHQQSAWFDTKRLSRLSKLPVMDPPDFVNVPGGQALPLKQELSMKMLMKQATQFILNSYLGKYGPVSWEGCTEILPFCVNHTDGFLCKTGDTQVICFRGSHGKEDWQDNLTFNKQEMKFGTSTVKVHTGFKTQYYTVRETVMRRLYHSPIILVCGHSLGGALATLCALDLVSSHLYMPIESRPRIVCITFGAPRVGGRSFANLFDQHFSRLSCTSLRFVFGNDVVPRVPTPFMNFYHVGDKIHLSPGGSWWERLFGSKNDHYPYHYAEAVRKMAEEE